MVLWAAIYLPGLGSTEIKGEEGRRILPAVTMLETGNWIVPHVGGKPFLRKPPLMNWLIAASFKITGVRNEWTARLPSALAVLALGLTMVAVSARGFSPAAQGPTSAGVEVGLIAAIFAMTQFGLLAKARFAGAEIEGVYVPLCGMAVVTWVAWWAQRRSRWLVWTVPFVFLGLAALAKGPLHLVFFYAIVITVLSRAGALRESLAPPHFAGIAMMAAIFAAWAVPYFQSEEAREAMKVWKDQFAGRVTDNVFDWKSYALNIPRGLMDQLPWLLFVPLLWRPRARMQNDAGGSPVRAAVETGTLLAVIGCFFVLLLIPGVLTRYVLPVGVPLALLLAMRLQAADPESSVLRRWHGANRTAAALLLLAAMATPFAVSASLHDPSLQNTGGRKEMWSPIVATGIASAVIGFCALVMARRPVTLRASGLVIWSGALIGSAAVVYATAAVPWIKRYEDIRPFAAEIDAAVPPEERLVLYDPGYLAAIFYLRSDYRYAPSMKDIPSDARWVLARERPGKRLAKTRPELVVARAFTAKGGQEFLLLQPRERILEDARP